MQPQNLDCDLLIIGLGVSGACAAIEARMAGADVLVLERASGGGGTSAMSDGVIYLGGGTTLQRDLGVEDDPEALYTYLAAITGVEDKAIVRRFADGSVEHFDWLEARGVPFARKIYTEKHLCPSDGEGLYSTSSEKVWPYREMARPALRGHLVQGPPRNCGAKLMEVLLARCEELGVRVIGDARLTALVREEGGRVTGATFRHDGADLTATARAGVLIATGGFQMNKQMVGADNPELIEHGEAIGTDYSDGSGITVAQAIGAGVTSIDKLHTTACFYPPAQLIKGIIVNRDGERFVAEDSYHGRTTAFILKQPEMKAWLILDSEIFAYPELHEQFQYRLVDGWETVAEMENALGMPTGALQKTMADYTRHAANGEDPTFHKYPDWLKPLDKAPYAAFDLSVGEAHYFYHSLGGLSVDSEARVLDTAGAPIPGLYAAGSCAAGIIQTGEGYGSGMTLANGSFFGRIAAQHAIDAVKAAA